MGLISIYAETTAPFLYMLSILLPWQSDSWIHCHFPQCICMHGCCTFQLKMSCYKCSVHELYIVWIQFTHFKIYVCHYHKTDTCSLPSLYSTDIMTECHSRAPPSFCSLSRDLETTLIMAVIYLMVAHGIGAIWPLEKYQNSERLNICNISTWSLPQIWLSKSGCAIAMTTGKLGRYL